MAGRAHNLSLVGHVLLGLHVGLAASHGVLSEQALVLRQLDLARLDGAREDKDAIGGLLRVRGLVRGGEGDESPVSAGSVSHLDEDLRNLSVLRVLATEHLVGDAVRQRANKDLLGTLHRGLSIASAEASVHASLHHLAHAWLSVDRILTKLALVPGEGDLAGFLAAREDQDAVCGLLGELGLGVARVGDKSPLSARLATRLDENVHNVAVLAELRPKHLIADVVGERADEDFLGAIWDHLLLGESLLGSSRDGVLAEQALVSGQSDLTRSDGTSELEDIVGVRSCGLSLLRCGEGDEAPLLSRRAALLHVNFLHGTVLAELRDDAMLVDHVGQRAYKDLLGRRDRRSTGGRTKGLLSEHALVLRKHDVAGSLSALELELAIAAVLGQLGHLMCGEGDESPLPVGLAIRLDVDIFDGSVLGELRHQRLRRNEVGERSDEDLAGHPEKLEGSSES
mmetsp:Transcript_13550/g.29675  ORF Transcript_13550/g.29675 Transcript_13550/m.29675 type:complete len:454 (-) Transcript_13550:120-1481(-)